MSNRVNVHMSCNDDYCIQLTLECPSCHAEQMLPIVDTHTGIGFVCSCGEEFPVSVDALYPVQQRLNEIRALADKVITLPI